MILLNVGVGKQHVRERGGIGWLSTEGGLKSFAFVYNGTMFQLTLTVLEFFIFPSSKTLKDLERSSKNLKIINSKIFKKE